MIGGTKLRGTIVNGLLQLFLLPALIDEFAQSAGELGITRKATYQFKGNYCDGQLIEY